LINKQITLTITGMHCGGCVESVDKALKGISGVSNVSVNLKEGKAVIDYDPAKTSQKEMVQAVKKTGFGAA
jgi:copper chaperone CopZ